LTQYQKEDFTVSTTYFLVRLIPTKLACKLSIPYWSELITSLQLEQVAENAQPKLLGAMSEKFRAAAPV
jgi:hypothetical protein